MRLFVAEGRYSPEETIPSLFNPGLTDFIRPLGHSHSIPTGGSVHPGDDGRKGG